jgi:hypothetical protein
MTPAVMRRRLRAPVGSTGLYYGNALHLGRWRWGSRNSTGDADSPTRSEQQKLGWKDAALWTTVGTYNIPGAEEVDRREVRGLPGPVLKSKVGSMAVMLRSASTEGDGYDIGE